MNCSLSKLRSVFLFWVFFGVVEISAIDREPRAFVRFVRAQPVSNALNGDQTIRLFFEVKEGYHIQSDKQDVFSTIPTKISIEPSSNFQTKESVFPAGKPYRLAESTEDLEVFDGGIKIDVSVGILGAESLDRLRLRGQLYYQACDDRRCFYPRTLDFEVDIDIMK